MKIQFISDTHEYDFYSLNPNADLIIHGGDAGNSIENLLTFHERTLDLGISSLVVPGNHDYGSSSIEEVISIFKEKGINYLDENTTYVQDGITFVGGTLFTNFRRNTLEEWEHDDCKNNFRHIGDYRFIAYKGKLITPEDYVTLFNQQYNHINSFRNKENVVVVTHFPPLPSCSSPLFDPTPLRSSYFTNDLDIKGFSTWLFGHTHYNINTEEDGCRLISNAYGYPSESLGIDYNPDLLIEI